MEKNTEKEIKKLKRALAIACIELSRQEQAIASFGASWSVDSEELWSPKDWYNDLMDDYGEWRAEYEEFSRV